MNTPEHYLSLAKEKVAEEQGYDNYKQMKTTLIDLNERTWNSICELALQLQAEDAEKEKAKAFDEGYGDGSMRSKSGNPYKQDTQPKDK